MSHNPLNPRIAGVRLSMLLHLYLVRLRSHAVQELLAGGGIAVGVALVLGVLVANTSLTGSTAQLLHALTGTAQLQLQSRSEEGFGAGLATRAAELPGVRAAGAVLRATVSLRGEHGTATVQLLGVSHQAVRLVPAAPPGARVAAQASGLLLPAGLMSRLGMHPGAQISVLARGRLHRVEVEPAVSAWPSAAASSTPVAVTSLTGAQRLTGLTGRATQVLVAAGSGRRALAEASLERLAGGRLDVEPADHELELLDQAAAPNNRSTTLFAAISVMVGFLLALNAMLLTVPERRRFVADLRMQGYDWRQVLTLLGFQALVLGLLASAAGVGLGILLSRLFLRQVPTYLTSAFPVGSHETVGTVTVLAALGAGVTATVLASLTPVADLRPGRPTDGPLRERDGGSEVISRALTRRASLAGAISVAVIVAAVVVLPSLTIAGGVGLALSTLCALPGLFTLLAGALRALGERVRSSALIVVVAELRATTMRTLALAGVAALAVYGSVAIGGARDDLIRGLDANFGEYLRTADLWVTTGDNDLTTNSFTLPAGARSRLRAIPGVSSVRTYQGAFLDVGKRRMWVIARPSTDNPLLPASQLQEGDLEQAERRVRSGWAAVSRLFAAERGLRVGDSFTLPTPSGAAHLRVAALISNLGWAPGALVVESSVFHRYWGSSAPSALEVGLDPGASPAAVRRLVISALGAGAALGVQTRSERERQYAADSRQGLQALSEIATLLLIAAALAVASALSAAIWQRRRRLASLKIQGYGTGQLWRALLLESAIVLGAGCAVGAAFGVCGHALASRWLRVATGFPAPFAVGLPGVFLTLLLLAAIALTVISLPGLVAARVSPRVGFQE